MPAPNILFLMMDQLRFDTVAALGHPIVYTPNLDLLVKRGVRCTNAYSPCPVCVPARYNIRTGCEPATTAVFDNRGYQVEAGQPINVRERCGPFIAEKMNQLGYSTFGIGKFHCAEDDLGYQTYLPAEELWGGPQAAAKDVYLSFLRREHPEFDYIEQPHGERTEMYYMPQCGALPAAITYEAWAADMAVEQIAAHHDSRPYFGMVSMIGPHPPCAPPIPYHRLYDPDKMPEPIRGIKQEDLADEQLRWMNHLIWAEQIGPMQARALKARYFGEVTYIDACIGRILDAVQAGPDADNTLIVFFSDHGDHLGDHHAWQKESFFDVSCRVPFLVSWPDRIQGDTAYDSLVSLNDLFGLACHAAGDGETRDGINLLGALTGKSPHRETLFGTYGVPGTPDFKMMVRRDHWKYIFLSNGGHEQLFDLAADPHELCNLAGRHRDLCETLHRAAAGFADRPGTRRALDESGRIKSYPRTTKEVGRIKQMATHRGVHDFPAHPRDVLDKLNTH